MTSIDAQPKGVSTVTGTRTAADHVKYEVNSAPPGKTMLTTVLNSQEEVSFALHKFQNMNKQRAREAKRDLSAIDAKKLGKSAFSKEQVDKIDNLTEMFQTRHFGQNEIVAKLKEFKQDIGGDFSQQSLALLSLKQGLIQQSQDPNNTVSPEVLAELDKMLEPAERSLSFQADAMGYAMIGWSQERGMDADTLREALKPVYPIELDNMQMALAGLREKFGDGHLKLGTNEIYKQLSAQYHASGRDIDKAELVSLLRNMSQLKTLLALYDECQTLANLLTPKNQRDQSNVGLSVHLLNQLVDLQSRSWVEQSDITRMVDNLKLGDFEAKNIFGVQLNRLLNLIPAHMFLDHGHKQQSLDVIFQFMDQTARQEAEYA